jgi:hypothetical protein
LNSLWLHRKLPWHQLGPHRPRVSFYSSRASLLASRVSLQGSIVRLHFSRVSVHGSRVSLHGSKAGFFGMVSLQCIRGSLKIAITTINTNIQLLIKWQLSRLSYFFRENNYHLESCYFAEKSKTITNTNPTARTNLTWKCPHFFVRLDFAGEFKECWGKRWLKMAETPGAASASWPTGQTQVILIQYYVHHGLHLFHLAGTTLRRLCGIY